MVNVNSLVEAPCSISLSCVEVPQNIGSFYVGAMSAYDLIAVSWVDVRRIEGERRGFETYLGIQRPLNDDRVKKISDYVKTVDACFPGSVILSVPVMCAEYQNKSLTLSNYIDSENKENNIIFGKVASVLDGQHRIEGLRKGLSEEEQKRFMVPVSVFVDIDIAEQAYIFSTVNLAQTKVSKSLAYDLFDLAKSRSPQKLAHTVSVVLDRYEESPLFERIKRLGSATPGRRHETITQAAFVESILPYITPNAEHDRDLYLRGKKIPFPDAAILAKHPLRGMMIEEMDDEISELIMNYFSAVRSKWRGAWDNMSKGNVLNKTNGFKALMKFFGSAYLFVAEPGKVASQAQFYSVFDRIDLKDEYFNVDNYPPGSTGQSRLYRDLMQRSGLDVIMK